MATQGVLPFRYECEPTASGMTALAGLPPYLELAVVSGLTGSIRRHLRVCAVQKQGWSDAQIVMSLVLLNLAGRVISRARQLVIRLSQDNPAYELLLEVRQRLRALWTGTALATLALSHAPP